MRFCRDFRLPGNGDADFGNHGQYRRRQLFHRTAYRITIPIFERVPEEYGTCIHVARTDRPVLATLGYSDTRSDLPDFREFHQEAAGAVALP